MGDVMGPSETTINTNLGQNVVTVAGSIRALELKAKARL